ncbi:MAG: hypothetical protein M3R60_01525, partial [Pseudomonadota bacterium]|nr:hypothetical protein [Pseudomonadota bacterium]
ADPCATAVKRPAMTRGISPGSTRSSVLRWQLPSMGQGFALRRKSTVSSRVQRQVMQLNHPINGHGCDRAVRCACRIVVFNPTPRIQTP